MLFNPQQHQYEGGSVPLPYFLYCRTMQAATKIISYHLELVLNSFWCNHHMTILRIVWKPLKRDEVWVWREYQIWISLNGTADSTCTLHGLFYLVSTPCPCRTHRGRDSLVRVPHQCGATMVSGRAAAGTRGTHNCQRNWAVDGRSPRVAVSSSPTVEGL